MREGSGYLEALLSQGPSANQAKADCGDSYDKDE